MMRSLFAAVACILPVCAQVKLAQGDARITVEIDGKPFTTLYMGPETTKPYLHPLRAASGTVVSRYYPMEQNKAGERKDHIHQRGLWFSHGEVNGYDFWANDPSQQGPKKGKIVLGKIAGLKSGQASGSLDCRFAWNGPDGATLLTEDRGIVFYSDPKLRTMDFDITLTAVRKVKFGDTKEGTFAIRVAPWLEEPSKDSPQSMKRTGKMINAEGLATEREVWGKQSPWVDYFGQTPAGETLGIAIFDHPANPRHPTYWHSRSYGLFAANIFSVHDFKRAKAMEGEMTLEPGQKLRFRYRVVIHPGDTREAGIAEMFQKYAK